MNEAQAKELLQSLVESTKAGRLSWIPNATNDGFFTEVASTIVEVRRSGVPGRLTNLMVTGNVTYVLEIRNQGGRQIASFFDKGHLLNGTFVHESIAGPISYHYGVNVLFDAVNELADIEIARLIRALK